MVTTDLTVSVVIPILYANIHDFEHFIESLTHQDLEPDEVILSIEENSDGEAIKAWVEQNKLFYSFSIIICENKELKGIGSALNKAVSMACGNIIVRHDIDDIIHSDRLITIRDYFAENANAEVIYSDALIYNKGKAIERHFPRSKKSLSWSFLFRNPIVHPTVAFKKSIVEKFGNYNSNLRFCEDLDLWLRWFKQGVNFSYIDKKLISYNTPETIRKNNNWKTNLKVRLNNFTSPNVLFGLFGALVVSLFLLMPSSLKKRIYNIQGKLKD